MNVPWVVQKDHAGQPVCVADHSVLSDRSLTLKSPHLLYLLIPVVYMPPGWLASNYPQKLAHGTPAGLAVCLVGAALGHP